MNREALDEFFARAEDVLTDWHGGEDAMHARVPDSDDVEALPGDSYYTQTEFGGWRQRWVIGADPDEFTPRGETTFTILDESHVLVAPPGTEDGYGVVTAELWIDSTRWDTAVERIRRHWWSTRDESALEREVPLQREADK